MTKRIGILTGGGDCPGLNAVIRALVRYAITKHDLECVGISHGWRGLLDGLTLPLDTSAVSGILPRGGTILRTSRTNPFIQDSGPRQIMENMKRFDLSALIVVGGHDALTVAQRMYAEHGLNVIGIPKTIDNDVSGTEYSFGFDSTINIAMEAIDRIHTTAESHDRVMIVEVMGHLTGWIATCAGLASGADAILIPEKPISIQNICDAILRRHDRGKDFSIVVIAEGARMSNGDQEAAPQVTQDSTVDEFGHARMGGVGIVLAKEIEHRTGFQTRVTVLGHLLRGGAPSAFDRILGSRYGVAAIDLAIKEDFGNMVAIEGGHIVAVPLDLVAKERKFVPEELFNVAETFFG